MISDYNKALNYLYASTPAFHIVGSSAYKPGLDNTRRLMSHLGNPEKKFKSVHIAGTNGKGSTSHLLAAVLQKAGYRVGLYTSPHLVDYRERIRINGQMIKEQDVVDFLNNNIDAIEKIRPSFFETTMALAFWYFAVQKVDIAVVEVGLGGRLDSTNIITPELSVITNIGYDHTEFLGDTLEQIATEKAGIIKPNIPVVIGERDIKTAGVFIAKAQYCCSPLLFASDNKRNISIPCELQGLYQENNKRTVVCAVETLRNSGWKIPDWAVVQGFANVCSLTGLRGRWEIIRQKPLVICDTGHNSHGIRYVAEQLRHLQCSRLHIVFGMVNDKDIMQSLNLLPVDAVYYFTQAQTKRAIVAEDMQKLFLKVKGDKKITTNTYSTVADAVCAALKNADDTDAVFVGGSNYVVGEALRLFG